MSSESLSLIKLSWDFLVILAIYLQTILEQQRIIRRLLRKSLSEGIRTSAEFVSAIRDNCFVSDPEDEVETGKFLLKI